MAVVVVKWSACSPSTLPIQVRILQTTTVCSVKFVFEKNENKQKKRPELAHFLKNIWVVEAVQWSACLPSTPLIQIRILLF